MSKDRCYRKLTKLFLPYHRDLLRTIPRRKHNPKQPSLRRRTVPPTGRALRRNVGSRTVEIAFTAVDIEDGGGRVAPREELLVVHL